MEEGSLQYKAAELFYSKAELDAIRNPQLSDASQEPSAPESADLLYLEKFIGNRITNLNGAKPSKWRAMIRTERRI